VAVSDSLSFLVVGSVLFVKYTGVCECYCACVCVCVCG